MPGCDAGQVPTGTTGPALRAEARDFVPRVSIDPQPSTGFSFNADAPPYIPLPLEATFQAGLQQSLDLRQIAQRVPAVFFM